MRVLLTGWFSFLHGEITAGDVLALDAVRDALDGAGIESDTAWSPVFRPEALRLQDAAPDRYSHLIFVCGPLHGAQVTDLHHRYPHCRRIAVGVSVIDRLDPAVTGFDAVLARDGATTPPARDLAAQPATTTVPVAGVILASGQGEYGDRRRHEVVTDRLTQWVGGQNCAPVLLDTRLDRNDWRLCGDADAVVSVLARLDLVVTTRLHGLVLGLRAGVPVLAVDPVAGGGKVTAQAGVWSWPVLAAEETTEDRLGALWQWCLSATGHRAAAAASASRSAHPLIGELLAALQR